MSLVNPKHTDLHESYHYTCFGNFKTADFEILRLSYFRLSNNLIKKRRYFAQQSTNHGKALYSAD